MSSQRSNWRERLFVNPSRMELELAAKLESTGIQYQTQVEVPITTADFYFATDLDQHLFSLMENRISQLLR